jgi:POT family proton-dependent oligopeptide transporter
MPDDASRPVHGRWGHPPGLSPLFHTELWERFSFYGMRGLLVLYMTAAASEGGLGFDVARAGAIYGLYSGLVYLACLPGGWLADRFLGTRRATLSGGLLILIGHLCMAWPVADGLYLGMAFLVLGTGLLKPSISTLVGQLYAPGDPRRDSGFSLYYMGINIGAFLAPLACGWLALSPPVRTWLQDAGLSPHVAWHAAFGAAAIGMFIGLVIFLRARAFLPEAGERPAHPPGPRDWRLLQMAALIMFGLVLLVANLMARGWLSVQSLSDLFGALLLVLVLAFFGWLLFAPGWSTQERHNLRLIFVLFLGAVVFWSLFEQGSSTLTLFAERNTDRHLDWLGYAFPTTWFHSLNPLLIISLAPVFAVLWVRLGQRNPSSTTKFALGLLLVAAGFGVLVFAAQLAASGAKVSPLWLVATYVLHSLGELCLSPVGLSAMTRLAPARIAGLTMGVWFLAASVGNYLGGRVAAVYERFTLSELFGTVAAVGVLAAALLAWCMRGQSSHPSNQS